MSRSLMLTVSDSSRVGVARREAILMAQLVGFSEVEIGKVGIVATEAASNLVKHARGGQVLLRRLDDRGGRGIEVMAIDRRQPGDGTGGHSKVVKQV
jgi:anti-sigma regulatory factor (Ser/Thr protein kinase)